MLSHAFALNPPKIPSLNSRLLSQRASLNSDRVILLDGGLASELVRQGADLSGHLWSAKLLRDNPDLIVRTHKAYFLSGADVATTASYQATDDGFQRASRVVKLGLRYEMLLYTGMRL